MQPHKHHEGEITKELIVSLREKVLNCWEEVGQVPEDVPNDNLISPEDVIDLALCLSDWGQQLHYAAIRLDRIYDRIDAGLDITADDHKVVDICLSILDDYAQAKSKHFLRDQ